MWNVAGVWPPGSDGEWRGTTDRPCPDTPGSPDQDFADVTASVVSNVLLWRAQPKGAAVIRVALPVAGSVAVLRLADPWRTRPDAAGGLASAGAVAPVWPVAVMAGTGSPCRVR